MGFSYTKEEYQSAHISEANQDIAKLKNILSLIQSKIIALENELSILKNQLSARDEEIGKLNYQLDKAAGFTPIISYGDD